jgi:hypothetical protein
MFKEALSIRNQEAKREPRNDCESNIAFKDIPLII